MEPTSNLSILCFKLVFNFEIWGSAIAITSPVFNYFRWNVYFYQSKAYRHKHILIVGKFSKVNYWFDFVAKMFVWHVRMSEMFAYLAEGFIWHSIEAVALGLTGDNCRMPWTVINHTRVFILKCVQQLWIGATTNDLHSVSLWSFLCHNHFNTPVRLHWQRSLVGT